MADITLKNISHQYLTKKNEEREYAVKNINHTFQDGLAYALLGPSGCGKTTLLNIISGLITPTQGQLFFAHQEVTRKSTKERCIAQVFQFPVVYDTMTVFNNLAFPLKNQNVSEEKIKKRVSSVSQILDLDKYLFQKASSLSADLKQKISLGRGLVREKVNIIMFDEPLTVIDPQLKLELRKKLKELHQKINTTLIYVTHDQTEALTFADQVLVMHEGKIVQKGTPTELFKNSQHVFVGHFIGSPGMNLIPCEIYGKNLKMLGFKIIFNQYKIDSQKNYQVGIRPEFIDFSPNGIPVKINKVQDLGKYNLIEFILNNFLFKMITLDKKRIPNKNPKIKFNSTYIHLFENGWRIKKDFTLKMKQVG